MKKKEKYFLSYIKAQPMRLFYVVVGLLVTVISIVNLNRDAPVGQSQTDWYLTWVGALVLIGIPWAGSILFYELPKWRRQKRDND